MGSRATNLALLPGSLTLAFLLIELGYRLIDPFPYYSPTELNKTEHGNLSQYDHEIGWSGIPDAEERFTTHNASVMLQHNNLGFRDIEPKSRSADNSAIVFLGDSFTWGYEVDWDEMFVNRLRKKFPEYEIYNLAHRGYGTDQSLLTFRRWRATSDQPVSLVILMFSGNDIADNNSHFRYQKEKPVFEIRDNMLVLTNVPVPRTSNWKNRELSGPEPHSPRKIIKALSASISFSA